MRARDSQLHLKRPETIMTRIRIGLVCAVALAAVAGVTTNSGGVPRLYAQTGAPAGGSSPAQIVADAAEALGGRARVMAVKTLTIEGEGSAWATGGGVSPGAEPNRTKITDYKRLFDLANGRMRLTQTGMIQYPFALGGGPNQTDQRLDGDIAFGPGRGGFGGGGGGAAAGGRGGPPALVRANAAALEQRKMEFLSNPLTAVRAALDPSAKLAIHTPASAGGDRAVDVTTAQGQRFTLAVDHGGLPKSISWNNADANWGDVVEQAVFLDYIAVGALKLPSRLETMTYRWLTSDLRVKYVVDGEVGDLTAPDSVRNAPAAGAGRGAQPGGGPQVMVTADPVAKGVWYMGGTGEHSVLFEFADHLVLFETPGPEARTLAVVQKARETVPAKPLTIAINSHPHFDHAGGFRAAVSEGLTIYTHEENVAHFKEIAARPYTMNPDVLQRKPKALKIMPIGDTLEMKDGQMDIVIYHVRPSAVSHTTSEVMVWVPRDRLLLEGDQFDKGWTRHLWGENFIWNVEQLRKLNVDKILAVHGDGPENWNEVVSTIRSKPTYYPTDVPGF
jgi:glyoxylase-like metal-dependent hydrolase (beta-lactamase superfamily II)